MKIILASKSPRRKEILEKIGLSFETVPANVEEIFKENEEVKNAVVRIAKEKSLEVFKKIEIPKNTLVISADTVVYLQNEIIGQPKNEEEAKKMLQLLQGKIHTVYTGVCVVKDGEEEASGVSRSLVEFYPMSEKEINWYVESKEPMDKAGAYG
ncbi:MAG: Maf family protein, partial [Acidobacteria bacterium]|nr:Maf family protein [Acidobacteriota bacterium]